MREKRGIQYQHYLITTMGYCWNSPSIESLKKASKSFVRGKGKWEEHTKPSNGTYILQILEGRRSV